MSTTIYIVYGADRNGPFCTPFVSKTDADGYFEMLAFQRQVSVYLITLEVPHK